MRALRPKTDILGKWSKLYGRYEKYGIIEAIMIWIYALLAKIADS